MSSSERESLLPISAGELTGSSSGKKSSRSSSSSKLVPSGAAADSGGGGGFLLSANFIACLVLGPINFLSYKIMYNAFGEGRAFFVSQGVNFLYVLYGGVILHMLDAQGKITPDMRQIPHYKFFIMGCLDSLGGFFAAMGAVHTSGSLQQLLNQTLIPITMFFSWSILGRGSSAHQILGSLIIVIGAWVVILSNTSPSTQDDESNDNSSTSSSLIFMSNMLYMMSNIPIALSCVYKEMGFKNMHVHVIYLTQMVSIYQLLIGFVLGLLQVIPGVGSADGSSLSEITIQFFSGLKCYLYLDKECEAQHTFLLLTGYCVLNFLFNITGLYLVKHDSAILSTLTNALVLPLTCLAFSLPQLGKYREPFDTVTLFGMCIVMLGFGIWRLSSLTWVEVASPVTNESLEMTTAHPQPLYQYAEDDSLENRRGDYRIISPSKRDQASGTTCACYGYVPHENRNRSRSNSLDSNYSAPDAFYDRVIVLSLNYSLPD